jgi:citrate lyase beta subunit
MKPRRSWMIVPAHDADAIARYPQFAPDVVVLDLEYTVPPKAKEAARAGLGALVKKLGDTQATVFVRIDRDTRWADVRAAIHRGIKGIVFPGADSADEVAEISELIDVLEKERGVESGVTELALMLESAKGFWDAAAIAQVSDASPRWAWAAWI